MKIVKVLEQRKRMASYSILLKLSCGKVKKEDAHS